MKEEPKIEILFEVGYFSQLAIPNKWAQMNPPYCLKLILYESEGYRLRLNGVEMKAAQIIEQLEKAGIA